MKSVVVTLHFVITTMKLFTYAQVHKWIRCGDGNNNGSGDGNNNTGGRERSISESDGGTMIARLCQKSGGKM